MNSGHIVFSNMTAQEEFRINGTLCEPTIERLIDRDIELENICLEGAKVYIKEARGSFVAEDFMTTVIGEISTIANRLRGRNKGELLELVNKLKEIESEAVREAEYGSGELRKALLELDPTHQ